MSLGSQSEMTFVEKIMNKCKHFTGIQNKACQKQVAYIDVRDSSASPYRWPCFRSENAATTCGVAEYPTREEAEREAKEWEDHFNETIQKIKEGKCPTCNTVVTKKQVGPCVYGSCGHRLYQGRL